MSTLTKEWLQQTIAELEEERDAIPGAVNEDADMALAAMKLALASMTAEPVAYLYKDNLHTDARFSLHTRFGNWSQEDINEYEITEIPLYTAPPAPVSVPTFEEWCQRTEQNPVGWVRDAMKEAYDACRAAMLQGSDGNSPAHYDLRPEQNNSSPAQNPIDHGYRPDCECSGCRGLAAICSDLNGSSPVITGCWCHACRPVAMTDMRLVVCPTCGNKRCPHANDHRNACTGSNEPGQEGSAYPAAPQQEVNS